MQTLRPFYVVVKNALRWKDVADRITASLTVGGSALVDEDYALSTKDIVMSDQQESFDVELTILDDTQFELAENLTIGLTNLAGGASLLVWVR